MHTVAGMCKKFFRDMPEPLFSFDLYREFLVVARTSGVDAALNFAAEQLPDIEGHGLPALGRLPWKERRRLRM